MRRLATVREIAAIRPIEGADKIVVAQVDGWECVVQKDEFKVGDKVVYVEVDSIMPERPEFEFLRQRKFRIKTIKLRGQISQGLVLPITILPGGHAYALGDDVTDILGVKKHDPQAEQERLLLTLKNEKKHGKLFNFMCRFAWFRKLFCKPKRKRGFPDWIVKTDEERIQNKTEMFEREKAAGTHFSVTEKIDGQSGTFFLQKIGRKKYEFGVCSRNVRIGKPDGSSYWSVAAKYDIEKVLRSLIGDADRIVLQGEIIGPGIQKNKYERKEYEFYAFNLIYPDRKVNTFEMTETLAKYGIMSVPVVAADMVLKDTIAGMVEFAKGKTVLIPGKKREGVVVRSYEKNISFKVINPEFLLANDE